MFLITLSTVLFEVFYLMAGDLDIARERIVDFELNVCDSQPAQLVGLHDEFVSSPRLPLSVKKKCCSFLHY